MDIDGLRKTIDLEVSGREMHRLAARLYPICRSITGNGFRQTLRILQEYLPLGMHEVPTGTRVFDWTVPMEWNISDAYISNSRGERIVDFNDSNLHVVSYSVPIHARMGLTELKEHLHSMPDRPDWIPYRTTYYKEDWGFCLSHKQLMSLQEDTYEVCIRSSLEPGHLTYGECYVRGQSDQEVLLSCHACHPSLANDNLSGLAVAAFLGRHLTSISPRCSYRILFIPGTIGSITWLARNEANLSNIRHGLVITCVGDPGPMTYKRSRRGNAEVDRATEHVLKHSGEEYTIVDFIPYGYDERQYCSPGFDLPVGSLQRTTHGQYPEYHTSADNCDFIRAESLGDSLSKYLAVLAIIEGNKSYLSTSPKCEPQLGRRGLYASVGGHHDAFLTNMAFLWVLNLSDGRHSLLDIAERSGMEFDRVKSAADALMEHDLLNEQL